MIRKWIIAVWKMKLTAYPGSSDFFESPKLFSTYKSKLSEIITQFKSEKTIDLAESPRLNGKTQTHT